jgi:hypothetical protein
MSHDHPTKSDLAYDHPIVHHDPAEGFDRTEPNVKAIFAFTAGSIIILVLVIVALQGYFDDLYQRAVYQKVLSQPSERLEEVRNRDNWNLTHYMYGDLNPNSGRVRIPVDRAMQLFAEEAASGKLFYPAKATPIKKEEPDAATPAPAK